MKIAVSATGKTLESEVSDAFGRCPYFLIVEIKNKKPSLVEAVENTSSNQQGAAGVSAVETVAEKNADAVITGNVGPRALEVLNQFKIPVYSGKGKAKKALADFAAGKLKKIE